MKTVAFFIGKKLYFFNGIPHIARKDVKQCHGIFVKQTNGGF